MLKIESLENEKCSEKLSIPELFDTFPFSDCSGSVFKCIEEKLLKQEVSQFQGRNAITAGAL